MIGAFHAWLATALAAANGIARAQDAPRRVAVIVAVSKYANLPAEVQPPPSRADAVALARYLEDHGGYAAVHTLYDEAATRDGVRALLLETLPPTLQPGDTLLLAFAGHGAGADIGDPALLPFDSRLPDFGGTGLGIGTFGPELARALPGVHLVVATDAAHAGAAEGVALIGPTAKSWPVLPDAMLLSATSPGEVAPFGLFLPIVARGLEGDADTNTDGHVTAIELHRFLVIEVPAASGDEVHPSEAGTYDPGVVLADAARPPAASSLRPQGPGGKRRFAVHTALGFGGLTDRLAGEITGDGGSDDAQASGLSWAVQASAGWDLGPKWTVGGSIVLDSAPGATIETLGETLSNAAGIGALGLVGPFFELRPWPRADGSGWYFQSTFGSARTQAGGGEIEEHAPLGAGLVLSAGRCWRAHDRWWFGGLARTTSAGLWAEGIRHEIGAVSLLGTATWR